jgi:hypothetical protein
VANRGDGPLVGAQEPAEALSERLSEQTP